MLKEKMLQEVELLTVEDTPVLKINSEMYLQQRGDVFVVTKDLNGQQQISKSVDIPREFRSWYQISKDSFPGWFALEGLACDSCADEEFQDLFYNMPRTFDEFIAQVSLNLFGRSVPDDYPKRCDLSCFTDRGTGLDNSATLHLCDPRKFKVGKEDESVFASLKISEGVIDLLVYYKDYTEAHKVRVPYSGDPVLQPLMKYCGISMLLTLAGFYHSMQDIYPYKKEDINYQSCDGVILNDSILGSVKQGTPKFVRSKRAIWELLRTGTI